MDWIKGFTYIFEDRNWFKKMAVGALVTSVPVVESISNGYQMQVIENLKAGSPQPLPEWADMNRMFGRGFKLWLAVNMFYIPSIIISGISWVLGIPFLLSLLAEIFAASATNDPWYKKGISVILPFVIKHVIIGIGIFLGSIALPVVFFFVPAMALRCQETGSLVSTLNLFAHIKFIMRHLGDYIVSRILIAGMLIGMHVVASALGGATIWVVGLGVLVAWFVGAGGRFWSRLAWAYFLVEMRMKERIFVNAYEPGPFLQSSGPEMPFNSTFSLTSADNPYNY